MENVILTVHLILALLLIGVVLLQRNEGGALLSSGGAVSARGAANALTKLTWILAAAFIVTSSALTILAARDADSASVVDRPAAEAPATDAAPAPALPAGDLTPPPAADAPVAPPAAD
ncbi:preprotein translocase subunit SecG [Ostreiculturibacter nitratireducens]|uniref:preprotein translocase subunit SecG n=1 Tax=Ostreiculturibacter nitratireducens TaxID=3075226 RepID=UPI0031B58F50